MRATMRLSLLNLSPLSLSEKEEVERTFRIHANEDDDHLVQNRTVKLWWAMPSLAFGMPRSWGRHEGDTHEKRGLCGISMKSFLEDTLISLQERCLLHGVLMAGENAHH